MKTIILTGSSSGFGLAGAKALASADHLVFATMRNVNGANAAVAGELKTWAAAHDARIEVVELDVTSNESVRNAITEIAEKSGGVIDVLINNAGLSYLGISEALSVEQTEQLFQVNTIAPERMMKAVLPFMHQQKSGLIINITSVQSRNLLPVFTIYNATKAALDAASVGYHYELKPLGIDVVTIQPGGYPSTDIITKGLKAAHEEVEKQYSKEILQFKKSAFKYFEPTASSPDPAEVATAMVNLVAQSAGTRPVWTVVGGGPQTPKFEAINKQLQDIAELGLQMLPQYFPAD